jgi:putative ABC transport system permease protein
MSTYVEGLRIAVTSILNNRTRAGLTTLGIMIGVGAVISLVSLGRGVEQFVRDEFNSLGANMLIVTNQEPEADTRNRIDKLSTGDVETLSDPTIAPSIQQIAAQYNLIGFVAAEGEDMQTSVRGVSSNYADVRNWELQYGSFITAQHVDDTERVAVIGPDVLEELYDDLNYDPTGNIIRVNDQTFTVIGVMEDRDEPMNNDNGAVLIPLSVAQTRFGNAYTRGGYEVSALYVQATSEETTYSAEREIDAYLWDAHGIELATERDYDINNMGEQLEIVDGITGALTAFLGIIAGVSLLVGGIGIMNIMLVTVTERTTEIGLRKALGAQPLDIMIQFLFESVLLSLVGGLIGILLGWLVAIVGTNAVEALTITISPDAILLATGVSTAIGVFFGLFPASRAARMTPIDALRSE